MKRLVTGLIVGLLIGSAFAISVSAQTPDPTPMPIQIAPVQIEVLWPEYDGMTWYDCWDHGSGGRMSITINTPGRTESYGCQWSASYDLTDPADYSGGLAFLPLAANPTPPEPIHLKVQWDGDAGLTVYDCWPRYGGQSGNINIYFFLDEGTAVYQCKWASQYNVWPAKPPAELGGIA